MEYGSDFRRLVAAVLEEMKRKEASRWWPYLQTLPHHGDWHPLLWSDEARTSRLPTWTVASKRLTERLRNCANDAHDFRSMGLGKDVKDVSGKNDDEWPSEADVRWASAICASRAFRLEFFDDDVFENFDETDARAFAVLERLSDVDEDVWGPGPSEDDFDTSVLVLVPWADGLNHSSDAEESSILRYDAGSATATLRAHKSYARGDQVFDSYGVHLSDVDVFLDFGFVVRNDQPFHVEFTGEEFVNETGEFVDSGFTQLESVILRIDPVNGVGENALMFADCFLAEAIEEHDIEQFALDVFKRMCENALKRFDKSIIEDCRKRILDVREGESMYGAVAASYLVVKEYDALKACTRLL
ncbi:hypothetical protein BE221DRAFT_193464 [Ostreococcus tauri]|nr:hypothetical protein BE221DRAFT_193464 [Ostreococcus tauri]